MNKEVIEALKENKMAVFGLIACTVVLVIMFEYATSIFNIQDVNVKDHWQTAIKALNTFSSCQDLTAHLQDHYNLDQSNSTDWYNYLAHEYYRAKDLGCTPLPTPIKTIQDAYHE